jgi:hypothetical protein
MLRPVDPHNPTGYTYGGPEVVQEKFSLSTLESQVRNIDTVESLFICAKINLVANEAIFRGFDPLIAQRLIISDLSDLDWISPFDIVALNTALRAPHNKVLFGRQGLYELMRWLALWDGPVVDSSRQRMDFIRALLNANELAVENQGAIARNEIAPAGADSKMFLALRLFRELTLWQSPTFDVRWQFGRANALFMQHFFGQFPDYRTQLESIFKISLEDYVAWTIAMVAISQNWFPHGQIPRLRSNLELDLNTVGQHLNPEMTDKMKRFLELTSRSATELNSLVKKKFADPDVCFELRPFRDKPLLTDGKNRIAIVDQALLAETCSTGLLFRLLPANGEAVFTNFGKAFEGYTIHVLNEYVAEIGTSKNGLLGWGPVFNAIDKSDELSDFMMAEGDTVVLFEAKTGVIKDSLVRETAEEFWKELMTRYGLSETHEGTKSKGVHQLARSIKRWMDGKAQLISPAGSPIKPKTIIPVLLVYDPYLPILGYPHFLAKEFNLALSGLASVDPSTNYNGVEVKTLCLMSIDQYERFEGAIVTRTLPQLLLEYCQQYRHRDVAAGAYLAELQPESELFESRIIRESAKAMYESTQRIFGGSASGE